MNRLISSGDRPRHQRHLGADASGTAPGGVLLGEQRRSALHTTSVTQAEVLHGIALLPAGKRRDSLAAAANAVFAEDFAGRVLPFDGIAAERFAEIVAARPRAGGPIENFDAQIAAIALAAGAVLATRDTDGFAGCGLSAVNPWPAD